MAQLLGPAEEHLGAYLAGFGIVAMEKIIPVAQGRPFAPIAAPEGSFEVQEALQGVGQRAVECLGRSREGRGARTRGRLPAGTNRGTEPCSDRRGRGQSHAAQVVNAQTKVNGGTLDVTMAKSIADSFDPYALAQQMCRQGMTQYMRAELGNV